MRPNWLVTGQQPPSLLERLIARQKMFYDKGNGIMEWLERAGRVQAARTRYRDIKSITVINWLTAGKMVHWAPRAAVTACV